MQIPHAMMLLKNDTLKQHIQICHDAICVSLEIMGKLLITLTTIKVLIESELQA